ncbi:MAG: extracellular solute-binding protein [Litorilinea sp.]
MKARHVSRRDFLRTTAFLGLGVAGSSLIAACGSPSPEASDGESGAEAPAAAVTEIRVQTPGLPFLTSAAEWGMERFNEENTDIQAISEVTPYDEILTKTEVGFATGTLQDIPWSQARWHKLCAYRGIFMPIDDLINTDPPDNFEDFFPRAIEAIRWEGELHGLLDFVRLSPTAELHYNKTLLEDAGVDLPTEDWTVLDLEAAARAVADPDNRIFGFEAPWHTDLHRLSGLTRAWGDPTLDDKRGWPISEDGTEFRLLEPLVSDAIQWFLRMLDDRVTPRAADEIQGGNFQAGILAFTANYNGSYVTYEEIIGDRFEWGAMMFPPGPDGRRGTCLESGHWTINSQSSNTDAAWQVVKRMTDEDSNIAGAMNWGKNPGRRSGYLHESVNDPYPTHAMAVPIMDEWLEPFPMTDNLRYEEARRRYEEEISFIRDGERTWDEYAETVRRNVQAVLDEPRPAVEVD